MEREGLIRVFTATKILGKTQFTIDVSLPGTLTAIVSIHPASAVIEPGQIVERGCHSVLLAAGRSLRGPLPAPVPGLAGRALRRLTITARPAHWDESP